MRIPLLCFSHLRWNFVYQRPQHLMSRFAKHAMVFFIEEPLFDNIFPRLHVFKPSGHPNLTVVTPHLPAGLTQQEVDGRITAMLRDFLDAGDIRQFIAWYYSPMALSYAFGLAPWVTVYDCMDELSAFKFAPAELQERESRLFSQADVVFTGGNHLYAAKKDRHANITSFPSSIDRDHFIKAREVQNDPLDQSQIPHPRLGYYGVIDERIDIALLEQAASLRPNWQFVLVGPVVKIDPDTLPRLPNIHYLGSKSYEQLPEYLAGWDIAIMPFAINESTKFISPTKTPEYLAGGKFVISTAITDVVNDYGNAKLVSICSTAMELVEKAEELLSCSDSDKVSWLRNVDKKLEGNSWDVTWQAMSELIDRAIENKETSYKNFLQTCSITL